jgi:hypothetical protein
VIKFFLKESLTDQAVVKQLVVDILSWSKGINLMRQPDEFLVNSWNKQHTGYMQ